MVLNEWPLESLELVNSTCDKEHISGRSLKRLRSSKMTDNNVVEPIRARPSHETTSVQLKWYSQWLKRRIDRIPPSVQNAITSMDAVFREVAHMTREKCSIEEMATSLVISGLVRSTESVKSHDAARIAAFLALGWQSMLFDPMANASSSNQLVISDTLDGYSGIALTSLVINYPSFSTPLPDLLIGFGLMLPKRNLFVSQDDDDHESFEKLTYVTPGSFNMASLTSLAGIKIKWIDVIAPHLELDKATNTLYLYRYPSFCVACLDLEAEHWSRDVLYGMASDDPRNQSWASEEEVTQFLKEILLSYRLLFAQDHVSRKTFKAMKPATNDSNESDGFLADICDSSQPNIDVLYPDRELYRLSRDFPILRARIAVLQQQLLSVKPRGWMAVWKDKRDTVQWWTFWAVIFFGGASILLSLLQVIFQAVQLFRPTGS